MTDLLENLEAALAGHDDPTEALAAFVACM